MNPIHMQQLGAIALEERRTWAAQARLVRDIRRANGEDRSLIASAGRLLIRVGCRLERAAKPAPPHSWPATVDPCGSRAN